MTVISGFDGQPAVPPSVRRRTDTPAGISDLLKDSRFDPAEAGQPPWSARTPSVADVRGYLARDVVYDVVDRHVPALAALWRDTVVAEVEPAAELALRLEELSGAEKRAEQEYKARVRTDLAAGKTPRPAVKADHEAERTALRVQIQVRRERIEQARAAYREAARAAMPEALAKVAAGLEERRAKAAAALGPAAAAFNAWRGDVAAADMLQKVIDPDDLSGRTTREAHELAAAAVRGLQATQQVIDSSDVVITGRRHVEVPAEEVPLHVRQAWWSDGSQRELQMLAALERSERWEGISRFTRGGR